VVVETYVVVMTFKVVLPFVNCFKFTNTMQAINKNPIALILIINSPIHWTPTNMSPNTDFANMDYFGHPI
jgi:hypothetical protein